MTRLSFDAAVIGAGAAGMAAAVALSRRGWKPVLVDREDCAGGILLQCIHNGFGLHRFGEELTGPEFSARLEREVAAAGIPFLPGTTVLSMGPEIPGGDAGAVRSLLLSSAAGVSSLSVRAVVLAMGSRERNRGNLRIAGDRPSGIFTAGLAQRLINIDGYLPGRRAVIIGSGDIGLIMARRLTLSGVRVEAVVEIQGFPSGLARNVAQCLDDFAIPLYLSHATLRILGRERVTGVEVAPLENGAPVAGKAFIIPCDTALLSVGLIPENELSSRAGIALDPATNGPLVDSRLMTNLPGVFAAGNVLHIHDLADLVAEEASRAGESCADWLDSRAGSGGPSCARQVEIPLRSGANVRYTVPSSVQPGVPVTVSLRSLAVMDRAVLRVRRGGREILRKELFWIRPGEMIRFVLDATGETVSDGRSGNDPAQLEVSLEPSPGGGLHA